MRTLAQRVGGDGELGVTNRVVMVADSGERPGESVESAKSQRAKPMALLVDPYRFAVVEEPAAADGLCHPCGARRVVAVARRQGGFREVRGADGLVEVDPPVGV